MKRTLAEKYNALQKDFNNRVQSGRLGNLSLSDLQGIGLVGMELLKRHTAKTVIENIANYFKHFGFMVTMDFDNINYVIVEV